MRRGRVEVRRVLARSRRDQGRTCGERTKTPGERASTNRTISFSRAQHRCFAQASHLSMTRDTVVPSRNSCGECERPNQPMTGSGAAGIGRSCIKSRERPNRTSWLRRGAVERAGDRPSVAHRQNPARHPSPAVARAGEHRADAGQCPTATHSSSYCVPGIASSVRR